MTDEDERMLNAGRYEDNWHLICVVLGEHPDTPVEQLVAQIHAIRGEARRSEESYERGWMEGNLAGLKEAAAIILGDLEKLKKETH